MGEDPTTRQQTHDARIGVVAIGRNEGERLRRCLASVAGRVGAVVYVDSGSTDGSAAMAREMGAEVLALDMSVPFTAARARNAGFARLDEVLPGMVYVQFLDGDCAIAEGWLEGAAQALDAKPSLTLVCGRRREIEPQATIYNAWCDREWDTPVGEASASGGDFMIRAEAYRSVGGMDETLIAGEEPEMCLRLRRSGAVIERLGLEMTQHDAAMTRFGQFWKRAKRFGHAAFEGAWRYGRSEERYCIGQVRSILLWAAWLPVVIVFIAVFTYGWGLLLFGVYLLQWLRLTRRHRREGLDPRQARWFAWFLVVGKFAEMSGGWRFLRNKFTHKQNTLIEYKGGAAGGVKA